MSGNVFWYMCAWFTFFCCVLKKHNPVKLLLIHNIPQCIAAKR